MSDDRVKTGLERLLENRERLNYLEKRELGVLANPASICSDLTHAIDALEVKGLEPVRLFGPEHGIRAEAQDMEPIESGRDQISGIPTVSLYGQTEKSLTPDRQDIEDLDVVIADLQDIGSRYYTYAYTLGLMMKVCGQTNTEVWVLDRPNPIRGDTIEGNIVEDQYRSFVGMQPLATRHGMTMGELAHFFDKYGEWSCPLDVIEMTNWKRNQWYDETGLPWVHPSPNMPDLKTAIVYPGMCLLEGTNCSEGRGTTRPFELFGAPYIRPRELKSRLDEFQLPGVEFRVCSFRPTFQKHAGQKCRGLQLHIHDRDQFKSVATGLCIISCLESLYDNFDWRTEAYEFVEDRLAIDLLLGDKQLRDELVGDVSPLEVAERRNDKLDQFLDQRQDLLLY